MILTYIIIGWLMLSLGTVIWSISSMSEVYREEREN